jgi:hypothetical protein
MVCEKHDNLEHLEHLDNRQPCNQHPLFCYAAPPPPPGWPRPMASSVVQKTAAWVFFQDAR